MCSLRQVIRGIAERDFATLNNRRKRLFGLADIALGALDQGTGASRWRLQSSVCHLVGDTSVDLVA